MKKGIIGIDVGGTNIRAALVFGRHMKHRLNIESHAGFGIDRSIQQIHSAVARLHKHASAIGIGIAGIIDSHAGVVRYSPNLKDWNNVPLARMITQTFRLPTRVLNDVNAICLGEWTFGAAKGYRNVFLFTLGTGVGGAAICEGRLLVGANGFAGEFGHTTIDPAGPKCICGQQGHLERYVGAKYIVARYRNKIKRQKSSSIRLQNLTPEKIAVAAKKGDQIALEVFSETGYYIGVGVANILALLDPDIVIISGGIARAGRILMDPIRKTASRLVLGAEHRRYKIVTARLGDDAGILGAALFAKSATKNRKI